MKRPLLRALILCMAMLCLLSACANDTPTDTTETTDAAETTAAPETNPPISADRLSDKYIVSVNSITATPGTFTDRITEAQLLEAMNVGMTFDTDPLLYRLVKIMGLSRENLETYSRLNADMLDAACIDGLLREGKAMREALRGDYTIMAGDYPYTVFELASMSEADFKALNIPEAELADLCRTVIEVAEADGVALDDHVYAFLGAHTAQPAA